MKLKSLFNFLKNKKQIIHTTLLKNTDYSKLTDPFLLDSLLNMNTLILLKYMIIWQVVFYKTLKKIEMFLIDQ